jgi:hypothetical protein
MEVRFSNLKTTRQLTTIKFVIPRANPKYFTNVPIRGRNCAIASDLLPFFRTQVSMISSKARGSMSKSRHTEAEVIAALKQVEAARKAEDLAREVRVWMPPAAYPPATMRRR